LTSTVANQETRKRRKRIITRHSLKTPDINIPFKKHTHRPSKVLMYNTIFASIERQLQAAEHAHAGLNDKITIKYIEMFLKI